MELHNLKPAKGSVKNEKRIARGQGSGHGGTATRGNKGQQSRSGYSKKFGFEGGQMPLQRRLPKFGFTNISRVEYKAINISEIEKLVVDKKFVDIDTDVLYSVGLVPKHCLVKILGNGKLSKKVNVKAHAFSKTAQKSIEELGGTVEIIK